VPELPEVEVVRRGLERHVVGRTIESVQLLHPRALRRHVAGPDDFAAALRGRTIDGARRRGKYLWLPAGDDAVLAHLGMSGQLLVGDPARPLTPHVRVRFCFTDGGPDLRFSDQRTFGHLSLAVGGAVLPAPIAHIAPDPGEPAFDLAAVTARLRARRTGIKRALLDQTLVSGIGNIYADEALWRARLHWARPAAALRPAVIKLLFASVDEVFAEALNAGGTSFDSLYVNVNGESGYFERSLAVYGREGRPCPRCGTPVRRDPFMNRSAFSCPACQPRPRLSTLAAGEGTASRGTRRAATATRQPPAAIPAPAIPAPAAVPARAVPAPAAPAPPPVQAPAAVPARAVPAPAAPAPAPVQAPAAHPAPAAAPAARS
jgi:formamidopyrimidine-DNA glycosylase